MRLTITFILLLNFLFVLAQSNSSKQLYQTNNKTHFHYIDLNNTKANVYIMGRYLDKAGSGYSIIKTDTLTRNSEDTYSSSKTKIISENDKLYLVTDFKKTRKFLLDTVKNISVANNNLNNAYYLDQYFKMSNELNKMYPLYHHSFRNGFYSWKELPNNNIDYLQFRDFADQRLKEIKDSISRIQDRYITLTNYIIQNVRIIDYNTLKDSLTGLPAEYKYSSWYYGTAVNEIAKQRPEYFFKLAEDFSSNRSLIFFAIENNKDVIAGLKAVEGHDEIKKAFLRHKK